MSDIIKLDAVTKRYADGEGAIRAVDDVTLSVAPGTMLLLVGPSGSGKTTLLMLIAGLCAPTSGEVHIDGEPVSRFREHHRTAFRRDHLGVVLQDLLLVPDLDALDNVLLPNVPLGVSADDITRATALLTRFGLSLRKGASASKLSGGERQRVALARALIRSPRILLFDEPTAHLDDASTNVLLDLFEEEREVGRTIVIATHDPRIIGRCDHATIIRMRSGAIIEREAPRRESALPQP